MRISKGILSFETLYAARTRGVQASDRNLTRFARSKAFIPSVYKRQYACQRLKSALAASSSSVGASPPSSSSLPAPVLFCRQVRRSFSYYSPIKIRYFNGNRRASRVGASHKNPTRRWRYKNKTIVLFLMDSSIRSRFGGWQGRRGSRAVARQRG